ncbi:MAG: hypothetical protein M9924_21760 [Rhizobiaceae bacterium]|nr:hypothetical protein [Rhizobiaceae bacterium]
MTDNELQHILAVSRSAKRKNDYGVLSTSERLTVAIVLNRPEWLAEMNYTLPEAIERVGPEWLALIPKAAKELEYEEEHAAGEA